MRICVRAGQACDGLSDKSPDMAEANSPSSASLPVELENAAEYRAREAWFTATPDPWEQLATLDYGGDRTYATTVNRMIVKAESAQHSFMEGKLIQVIARPEITSAGRQFVCRMLALVGSAQCVTSVKGLLDRAETADFGRMALDGIEDPAVDDAYRRALGQLNGAAKIGLIGSIAMRGDGSAIDLLTAIALDPAETVEVRAAAERAVEKLFSQV